MGHLWRQNASRVTVHHNAQYPSHLLLPITKENSKPIYPGVTSLKSIFHIGEGKEKAKHVWGSRPQNKIGHSSLCTARGILAFSRKYGEVTAEYSLTAFIERIGFSGG
jgi:hypothetical protein